MTEETKRSSRAKKTEEITEKVQQSRELSFAEVMAWNRANADKLPPAIELVREPRPKSKRI